VVPCHAPLGHPAVVQRHATLPHVRGAGAAAPHHFADAARGEWPAPHHFADVLEPGGAAPPHVADVLESGGAAPPRVADVRGAGGAAPRPSASGRKPDGAARRREAAVRRSWGLQRSQPAGRGRPYTNVFGAEAYFGGGNSASSKVPVWARQRPQPGSPAVCSSTASLPLFFTFSISICESALVKIWVREIS
jgi:hypothetical protein